MECKLHHRGTSAKNQRELIDTLWNVNEKLKDYEKDDWELIDTLWNVNKSAITARKHDKAELIDTLWNVNM